MEWPKSKNTVMVLLSYVEFHPIELYEISVGWLDGSILLVENHCWVLPFGFPTQLNAMARLESY